MSRGGILVSGQGIDLAIEASKLYNHFGKLTPSGLATIGKVVDAFQIREVVTFKKGYNGIREIAGVSG